MTDRKSDPDSFARADLAPEATNTEQADAAEQAQTVTGDALDHSVSSMALEDSEKMGGGLTAIDAQDLVDHIHQMEHSGTIDMTAFRGEDTHDDLETRYGRRGVPDEGYERDDS
ncbi:hypothetical protein B2G71_15705 [Novosphingobium sp. PC22D]|uniref:hypothetical protein n=1 Tax=Novosphingobium sp. PC22D TaxID=1962403 RepID=UPI000BF166BA|nr:hypothetical protein [Novosphingobium sp. PC22D]PEQ11574.1 hypothetical protein B2G71_15705 [Novosphingobium sp. PC22D]